jgi:hypothetical protein
LADAAPPASPSAAPALQLQRLRAPRPRARSPRRPSGRAPKLTPGASPGRQGPYTPGSGPSLPIEPGARAAHTGDHAISTSRRTRSRPRRVRPGLTDIPLPPADQLPARPDRHAELQHPPRHPRDCPLAGHQSRHDRQRAPGPRPRAGRAGDALERLRPGDPDAGPALTSGRCAGRSPGDVVTVEIVYDVTQSVFMPTTFGFGAARVTFPTQLQPYRVSVLVE